MNSTILVTGGAGYIGSITVEKLIAKGYRVVVFDNLSTGHLSLVHPNAIFYKGDLLQREDNAQIFEKENISAVLHFAGVSQVSESCQNPEKYFFNNIVGTLNLVSTMRENGVKKIIFSSSAAVFGDPVKIPIEEDHPKNPKNPYGLSKSSIEDLLAEYKKAYGVEYVSLRYFNAAGASESGEYGELHDPETHLIPNILKTAKGENPVFQLYGNDYETEDGTCVRDYIHTEDLADAHIKALEYIKNGGKSDVFNLGSGKGYSVREIIKMCEKITGEKIPVECLPRRAGDPEILVASNEKAKNILQWTPKKTLEDMAQSAWNFMNRRA